MTSTFKMHSYNPYWQEKYGFFEHIGILPGWDWLNNHKHDLDDYEPRFELSRPGFKCSVQLKDNRKLKEIVREVLR